MALVETKNLSFAYGEMSDETLRDVTFTVDEGDFVLLCGISGCGKTTLLRLLKPQLSPHGRTSGQVLFDGVPLSELSYRDGVADIGFVMQNPDAQTVTDSVWHELAFCAESLDMSTSEIRSRVAEICGVLGISDLFDKKIDTLSGGQKQLVNLASVLVTHPKLLLLDEPTAQLDPVAAESFVDKLYKINREQGVTVVLVEHRLDRAFSLADKVIVMDGGTVVAEIAPECAADEAKRGTLPKTFVSALPTSVKVFAETGGTGKCPLSIAEGRKYVQSKFNATLSTVECAKADINEKDNEKVLSVEGGYFRYERDGKDVLRGLDIDVYRNETLAVFGANGSGKTTLLRVLGGTLHLYKGKYRLFGKKLKEYGNKLYKGNLALLTQNPQDLFVADSVRDELAELAKLLYADKQTAESKAAAIAGTVGVEALLDRHPYDLSGGEQQRLALGKVLLADPQILLLDEPTKGLDAYAKSQFASLLKQLKTEGKTIVLVTHDVEFAAVVADRCAMFFDGKITTVSQKRDFFVKNAYYTTAARRLTAGVLKDAVTTDEAVRLLCLTRHDKSEVQDE